MNTCVAAIAIIIIIANVVILIIDHIVIIAIINNITVEHTQRYLLLNFISDYGNIG